MMKMINGILIAVKELLKNLKQCVTIDYPAGTWPGKKYSQIVPYGRGMHEFDEEKCVGCGACASMCSNKTIKLVDEEGKRTVSIYLGRCMFCGKCQDICPEEALKLTPKYELASINKQNLYVKNSLNMVKCESCEKFIYTEKQINSVKNRVLENLKPETKETVKLDMEKYLNLCPDCRKKLSFKLEIHPRKLY